MSEPSPSIAPYTTALYTAAQMRRIDACAMARLDITGLALMQRAAAAAYETLRRRWPEARRIAVLCGPGKNGGDGYLVARLAREAGADAVVLALGQPRDADAMQARAIWQASGGRSVEFDSEASLPEADVYVDALFGTGLARALDGAAAAVVAALSQTRAPVLALDIPSGVDADTGAVPGVAVRADATVSFIGRKRGQATGAAIDHCGDVELAPLDLPDAVHAEEHAGAHLLRIEDLAPLVPARARNVHKGLYGHVLAIGGDAGMGGAIRLAAEAALRCGAGLVSVATRGEHVAPLLAARPELMVQTVGGPQELDPLLERATVLALGPGLGRRAWGHALWHRALDAGKPCVLDADGLNLLAEDARRFHGNAVLTPHPAEAARLLGVDTRAVQADRYSAALALAERYGAVVVLKGAGSLIAAPGRAIAVCPWGNPGMASGGMGDVLTGAVAALLAQGLAPYDAAVLGVGVHALAGDVAAAHGGAIGLVAGDLMPHLRAELNGLAHG
ncbi:NAD(P)H-hydrate dehydratase [Tahibacter soli]|uniref:Bifunctional NAD(P)H-hydrate repair enzyme n=1 Tax=Tahibacter soli TaxID=2983605 RepID=A0A9X4BI23_9GAMM|nr:NAD(P)H-hydrate dehydratase [Tahibacter soli]MDC8011787.1 NAD(P)H-hydrate dehydratase [Tahibacter soli]